MQLTVREVANAFNVPERTVYRWIKDRGLPAYRIHEQYRFNRAELLEWSTSHNLHLPAQLFRSGDDDVPQFGLATALEEGGVFYGVGGADKESVLRAVVETMPLPTGMDKQFLFRVLLAREALGSTGLGDGIAIPHARNPIVLHVSRPEIALCFLAKPVDFAAIDGKPVHTLFSMISPTVRDHLHLLSQLAFALRDPAFQSALARRAPRDEILKRARKLDASLKQPARNGLGEVA